MSASDPIVSRRAAVGSSERTFGLLFTAFFFLLGTWPALRGQQPRLWALTLALIFVGFAFFAPQLLAPLNRLWLRLGLLMHHVVNPMVMAVVYYVAVVPTGLILRARGKDPLRLKPDASLDSYWIVRDPPGPPPDSMLRQF